MRKAKNSMGNPRAHTAARVLETTKKSEERPGRPSWRVIQRSISPSRESAESPRIFRSLFLQAFRGGRTDGLHFLRAKTKQGRNIPHFVKLGIIFHVKGLDISPDDPRQDGLANIHDLLRRPAANRAVADKMGIDMAAMPAFDSVRLQIFSD
jgi:hypothetical protein